MDHRKHFTDRARIYEIRIQGQLDESWSDWLEGMEVTVEDHLTILRGVIPDQAALRGILSKIWDVNLSLISIRAEEFDPSCMSEQGVEQ
jgi:hypothetical protein